MSSKRQCAFGRLMFALSMFAIQPMKAIQDELELPNAAHGPLRLPASMTSEELEQVLAEAGPGLSEGAMVEATRLLDALKNQEEQAARRLREGIRGLSLTEQQRD